MKTLRCSDAGFDCQAVVKANSDDEVLQIAAQHAREVHGGGSNPGNGGSDQNPDQRR